MTLGIYWAAILIYTAFVIYIGWQGYRHGKDISEFKLDFWSAGKSLGPWAAGLSISASFMSISWSCVYAVQLAYWYGLSALWLLAIPWLLTMLMYYVLTPHFRNIPAFSQPEMLAHRFGSRIRAYLALPLAFVFLVWGGAEIYAAAQVLSPILELPFHVVLAFVALVVALYSFLGGFSAVVATDKLQFALVAFFILAISYLAGSAVLAHSNFSVVISHIPPPPKTGLSALSIFAAGPALIFLTFIAYLPGWIIETDIWLRVQAARSHANARKGVMIAGFNSLLFIGVLPMIIGLSALYLYPPVGAEIPPRLNDGASIFALIIREHSPAALTVLLLVGLAAASMSTIDTCGNVVALSLSYDLLEPVLERGGWMANRNFVSRWMSAGAVILAYIYALFTESLWDIFYLSSGILTTTIFIPMVALFRKNSTKRQVQSAATVGFTSTLVLYFLEKNGFLRVMEPDWMAATGLGYIVFALGLSFLAYFVFKQKFLD